MTINSGCLFSIVVRACVRACCRCLCCCCCYFASVLLIILRVFWEVEFWICSLAKCRTQIHCNASSVQKRPRRVISDGDDDTKLVCRVPFTAYTDINQPSKLNNDTKQIVYKMSNLVFGRTKYSKCKSIGKFGWIYKYVQCMVCHRIVLAIQSALFYCVLRAIQKAVIHGCSSKYDFSTYI